MQVAADQVVPARAQGLRERWRSRSPGRSASRPASPSAKKLIICVRPGVLLAERQPLAAGERVEGARLADVRAPGEGELRHRLGRKIRRAAAAEVRKRACWRADRKEAGCRKAEILIKSRLSTGILRELPHDPIVGDHCQRCAFCAPAGAARKRPRSPMPRRARRLPGQVCAACHAADGNSRRAANPKLAGQFYEYLHKQLVNFKAAGRQEGGARQRGDGGHDRQSFRRRHQGSSPRTTPSQKLKPAAATDKDLAALGQKIYRGGNAADRRGGLRRLPRSRGRRHAGAVSAHCRAVPGVHRGAAQGVPRRHARQRLRTA